MIINGVGCPYSGTGVLRELLMAAGLRTRAGGPDLTLDRRLIDRRIPYDCYKFPGWVSKWIDEFDLNGYNDYVHLDKEFYHDAWERFSIMYALSQKYENLRFLIIQRNPREVIGKWFAIAGSSGPEVTADSYRNTILKITEFLYEQADCMEDKPIVWDYEKFMSGEYVQDIFDMYGIEKSLENIEKAQGHLRASRVRTKSYEGDVSDILFYQKKLMDICDE